MWILKNSKALLESLQANLLTSISSIKTFDFSTLYTSIPHSKLNTRLHSLIKQMFHTKNGERRYQYRVQVFKHKKAYLIKDDTDAKNKFTESDIIDMINVLIDNIFVEFGGQIFQQTIRIPMGSNCASLLADLFLVHGRPNLFNTYKRVEHVDKIHLSISCFDI